MAYLRRRGNQLAIVHGERDPATRKVEQHVLFTIYSRPEAETIVGKKGSSFAFERLLERQYPHVRFPWKAIRKGIESEIDALPETYEYREQRVLAGFHQSLVDFARQLMLADPQHLLPAGEVIREHGAALDCVVDLIGWRLRMSKEREPNQWNSDTPFFWRFSLQGRGVPVDAQEHAIGFYERRDLDRAEAAFLLLIEAFPGYADGHNYLGLIAQERGDLERAISQFERAIESGRKLFPRRIARSRYWSQHETRPYMRGLRNLASAFLQARRYEEARERADRLAEECGDDLTAAAFRSTIALNTGRWQEARDAAERIRAIWPSESLVAAFAQFELGASEPALASLLHAVANHSRATRIVLGLPSRPPKTGHEARDHNTGVDLLRSLRGYLAKPGLRARRHFGDLLRGAGVKDLGDRVEKLEHAWSTNRDADRSVFVELGQLRSLEFASARAKELLGTVAVVSAGPRSRRPVDARVH